MEKLLKDATGVKVHKDLTAFYLITSPQNNPKKRLNAPQTLKEVLCTQTLPFSFLKSSTKSL